MFLDAFLFLKKTAGGRTMPNKRGFLRTKHKCICFLMNTHYYYLCRRLFLENKTPEAPTGLTQGFFT